MRNTTAAANELEHRPVPEHSLVRVAAKDEPRAAGPTRPALLDAPAPRHPQMAPQGQSAFEAKKEFLADRLHRFQRLAVELLHEALPGGARMRRLDLHPLPRQHLQPSGRAVQTVALWHIVRVDGASSGGR